MPLGQDARLYGSPRGPPLRTVCLRGWIGAGRLGLWTGVFEVVHETDELLVINKPAGLVCVIRRRPMNIRV